MVQIQWNPALQPCHLVIMATFLGPYGKVAIHFLVKKPLLIWSPVNMAKLFWPIGDRINGVVLYNVRCILHP